MAPKSSHETKRKTHLTMSPYILSDRRAAMRQTIRDMNAKLGSSIEMPNVLVATSFDAMTRYTVDEIAKTTEDPMPIQPLLVMHRDWQIEQIRQWEGNIPPDVIPPDPGEEELIVSGSGNYILSASGANITC